MFPDNYIPTMTLDPSMLVPMIELLLETNEMNEDERWTLHEGPSSNDEPEHRSRRNII